MELHLAPCQGTESNMTINTGPPKSPKTCTVHFKTTVLLKQQIKDIGEGMREKIA